MRPTIVLRSDFEQPESEIALALKREEIYPIFLLVKGRPELTEEQLVMLYQMHWLDIVAFDPEKKSSSRLFQLIFDVCNNIDSAPSIEEAKQRCVRNMERLNWEPDDFLCMIDLYNQYSVEAAARLRDFLAKYRSIWSGRGIRARS